MSVKQPLKFGCVPLKMVALGAMRRNCLLMKRYSLCRLSMLGMNSARGRSNNATSFVSAQEPTRWNLQVDVERTKEDPHPSLPLLLYLYSPWQIAVVKFNLWKLKIFWDWHFSEQQFVDNSKQAFVVITKFIREERRQHIRRCSTPMGYKQIMHDLVNPKDSKSKDWPRKLLRFEKRHIRRAYLLKVQQLPHYDHKFAFMDVVFCACRRTNDFSSESEINEMNKLVDQFIVTRKLLVPYPIVFAEFFVRFRRDYSSPASIRTGQWLISTYKILKLDMLNHHPEFHVGSQHATDICNS
ncbi:uncharacterized protein LOC117784129 [Drosophila innubila]|uniref:uncharacterized protein LOC117784129 n=1 Tax=Drosophila innubila TaxID=198719 RepID=UPI00148BBB5C|nr:uncharacterized protein LOC117784129 [Drosophila innubila]